MPVAALMDRLTKRYGKDKGESVYTAMEASARGPFAPGAKHHDDHLAWAERNGVPPITGKRKGRPRRDRPIKAKVTGRTRATSRR